MNYSLTWEAQGVIACYEGHASCAGFEGVVRSIQKDPRWVDLDYSIHDASRCHSAEFRRATLQLLAASDRSTIRREKSVRIAIIAPHPQVRALAETFLSYRPRSDDVRFFSTLDEARAWCTSPL